MNMCFKQVTAAGTAPGLHRIPYQALAGTNKQREVTEKDAARHYVPLPRPTD